jgi:site-specific recombinase
MRPPANVRRARRTEAVRDRFQIATVGVCAVAGVFVFGWLSRQIGTTIMTMILLGILLIVCGFAVLLYRKLRDAGLRPPSLAELRAAPSATAAEPPAGDASAEPTGRS